MNKAELRKKYKQLRNKLSQEQIEDLSIKIANQLLKIPIWNKIYYHVYLPIEEKKEVDTSYILSILQGKDKEIVISKSHFDSSTLTHYLLTENTIIKKNNLNIPEPVDGIEVPVEKIDVIFIPLLAYDKEGNRIGYGKGFYDRFLVKCNKETIKIGLSFFNPEVQIEDLNKNDIKMDFCVTPKEIYCFSNYV